MALALWADKPVLRTLETSSRHIMLSHMIMLSLSVCPESHSDEAPGLKISVEAAVQAVPLSGGHSVISGSRPAGCV
jgi:hypothetical protein